MLLIRRRTFKETFLGVGTDRVFAWLPIPAGGKFLGSRVRASISMIPIGVTVAKIVGFSGYVVPVPDPDGTPVDPNTLWDQMVPKQETIESAAVEMDTVAADTTPEIDINTVDVAGMVDADIGNVRLFRFEEMMHWARSPHAHEVGSPDTYIPSMVLGWHAKRTVRVKRPSAMLMAMSLGNNPVGTTFIGTTNEWAPTGTTAEQNWQRLRFLEDTLLRSMPWLTGGTEAGAESPFQEAAELAGRIQDQTHQDTAGAFDVTNNVKGHFQVTYLMEVPGTMKIGSLGG